MKELKMLKEFNKKIIEEKEYFSKVSKFRFNDLGFSSPYIDIQGAIRAGKQIEHSPYSWSNDSFIDSWYTKYLPQWTIKRQIIKEAVSSDNCSCIDIGCGAGNISLQMARYGANVIGVDLCEESIRIANLAKENAKSSIKGSLDYKIANALDIKLPDNSIDAIIMVATIHHIPDASNYIEKVYKMLKPGGKLIILDHNSNLTRVNGYIEKIFRIIVPAAYLSYKEKFTFLFLGGIRSKIFSFTFGIILPNYIPLKLRLEYLFLSIFSKFNSRFIKNKKKCFSKILGIKEMLVKNKNKSIGPQLKSSPFDDSSDFIDYFPKIKSLFSNKNVKYINSFNAQSIIVGIPFSITDIIRRGLALFVSIIDNLLCILRIIKGHEVRIIAKK